MKIVHPLLVMLLVILSVAVSWYTASHFGLKLMLHPLRFAAIPIVAIALTAGQLIFKFSDLVTAKGLNYSQIGSLRKIIASKRRKLYLLCSLYFVAGLFSFLYSAIFSPEKVIGGIGFWFGVATLSTVSMSFVFTPYILVWHHEISEFYMRLAEEEEKRKAREALEEALNQEKGWVFRSDDAIDKFNNVQH